MSDTCQHEDERKNGRQKNEGLSELHKESGAKMECRDASSGGVFALGFAPHPRPSPFYPSPALPLCFPARCDGMWVKQGGSQLQM